MAHVQRSKPECPLCRKEFPAGLRLVVNHELRDLVKLTSTLHTVDGADGWQTLAAVKLKARPATSEPPLHPLYFAPHQAVSP